MAIYEIQKEQLVHLPETTFSNEGIQERSDLQRLLREQIEVISPDTMVIAEEFCEWEDSRRRIDLLGLDKKANLVVIELKRTETGGHMDLQAIRYAAMISTMTFQQVVKAHQVYLQNLGKTDANAEELILDFLDWDEPNYDDFAEDVRIILASAEFSKEVTSSVMWLRDYNLDIRCIRFRPHKIENRVLLDVQEIIPLPEAAEYQIRIREKSEEKREARQQARDVTKFDLTISGETVSQLTKRELAYRVASEAIKRGKTPRQLGDSIPWKRRNLWKSVEGNLFEQDFIEMAKSSLNGTGESFDVKRYFTADDKLIRLNGKTYAFTKEWGGRTLEAVKLMIKLMNADDIAFTASS